MQPNSEKLEPCRCFTNNFSQLMLGHFAMCLVFDAINLSAVFQRTNIAEKVNDCTCAPGILRQTQAKGTADQAHVTIAICHWRLLLVYCVARDRKHFKTSSSKS